MAGDTNVLSEARVLVDFTTATVAGGFTKTDGSHFLHYADSKMADLVAQNEEHPLDIREYKLAMAEDGDVITLTLKTDEDSQADLHYTPVTTAPFGTQVIQGAIGADVEYVTKFMSLDGMTETDISHVAGGSQTVSSGGF